MSKYISKEIVLNNIVLPEGVSILYSTWKILDEEDNIVLYIPRDDVNLTSRMFNNVFEVGKKYKVIMSLVRTDGPTIETKPLEVVVFSGEDIYELYPMPSVVDTPIISMDYVSLDTIPNSNIKFKSSDLEVYGNATHDSSSWWLTDDKNEVIWSKLNSQEHKTNIIIDDVVLNPNRLYTISVVYKATNRDLSGVGSLIFKPADFSILDLSGDMNNTYYGYGIDTRLKDIHADMTLFEYKLFGDDLELYSNSNTTGELNFPNIILVKDYEKYRLSLKLTTSTAIAGWKDINFKPKEFIVESDIWNDDTVVYDNTVEVVDGKVYNYDNTEFKLPYITPSGKTYQLPNKEILLLRSNSKIGRFSIDEDKGSLRYIGDLYIPQIPARLDYNVFTFKMFNTGDVFIGLGYSDYTIYHMKYDPINNIFKYITTYNIDNGGSQVYSEMHLISGVVVFMSEGVNDTPQNIYGIHIANQTLEILASDIINNSKNGNLLRLDENTLLVRGGINKTTNSLMNDGKLLTLDIVGSTINLSITTDNRISIPSSSLSRESALQATLKNNKVILKQFSPFELKSSDLTVVRYVWGNIKPVNMDYSKGVVVGNKKYYAPRNGTRVLVTNLDTGDNSFIGDDLGLTKDKYFYGVLADNDKIYFIPVNASKVLEVDTTNDIVTLIGIDLGTDIGKYHKPIKVSNGSIYCPPVNATQVLKIVPNTSTVSKIGAILASTVRKYFSGSLSGDSIYCPPVNATQVLKINTTNDTVALIGIDLGVVVGKYYKAKIADNGKLYCPPLNASKVLEINPNTDMITLIGDDLGIDGAKYINGVEKDSNIYYAPLNTNRVLKVDTTLSTAVHVGSDLSSVYDLGNIYDPEKIYSRYYIGKQGNNGKIYYAPVYASKVLEINPSTDTTQLVGKTVGGFNMYVSAVEGDNGKLYFIPYNTPDCLEVDPSGLNTLMHTFNILTDDKNDILESKPFNYKSVGGEKFQFTIYLNNGKRVFMSYTKDNPKMLIYK